MMDNVQKHNTCMDGSGSAHACSLVELSGSAAEELDDMCHSVVDSLNPQGVKRKWMLSVTA
jgi:hypothetical protein